MIVCPPTLIDYWVKTIKDWNAGYKLKCYALKDKRERDAIAREASRKNRNPSMVLVVSPNIFEKEIAKLVGVLTLDILVIDEGHKAKN